MDAELTMVEIDLEPATRTLAALVRDVPDAQLVAPTPCTGIPVAALVAHIDQLAVAFAAAADKRPTGSGTPLEQIALQDGWRDRVPERLSALAAAWRDERAWEGTTAVGGLELPGRDAAAAAVDELLMHGWDLATATGQEFAPDEPFVEFAYAWVQPLVSQSPGGVPGLFGPAVPVAPDAPVFQRLLGLTGRCP